MTSKVDLKNLSVTLLDMDNGLDDLKCSAHALGCIRDMLMFMNPNESPDTRSLAHLVDVVHQDLESRLVGLIDQLETVRNDLS